ncbi:MAG TPA: pyridoxal-phosphate dependent enzyme, partial [Gaiellaceae bacterium]
AAFLEQRRPSRVTPRTEARSLAVGDPSYGELALGSARVTGGAIRSVPEDRIRSYSALLAEMTGVFADSAAGVALGALLQCLRDGVVEEGARVVLVVTGTPAQQASGPRPREIAASADAFLSAYAAGG